MDVETSELASSHDYLAYFCGAGVFYNFRGNGNTPREIVQQLLQSEYDIYTDNADCYDGKYEWERPNAIILYVLESDSIYAALKDCDPFSMSFNGYTFTVCRTPIVSVTPWRSADKKLGDVNGIILIVSPED